MMRGGGGMGGGMMRGMRGTSADSMFAPTNDNLTDEDVVGRVYDNRVVMRFMTFIKPYKGYALLALASLLVYAAVNAGIPLLIKYGIDWAIAEGEVNRVHIIGAAFMVITVIHFLSNRLQFIFIARTGQHVLYDLRSGMFSHLQNQSNAFYHRTPIGRVMSRMQSDILQLQETFELLALALGRIGHRRRNHRPDACRQLEVGAGLHVRRARPHRHHDVLAAFRSPLVHAHPARHRHGQR